MNITRTSSMNNSKDARNHAYDNSIMNDPVNGRELGQITDALVIGDATIDQFNEGVFTPSVQAAIDQLTAGIIPVGGVLTTTSVVTPSGVAFVEDLEFTGNAAEGWVEVYGLYIPVTAGDVPDTVASLVTTYLSETGLFRSVALLNTTTVRVTHRDNMNHLPYTWSDGSLTITGTVNQESNKTNTVYYGTWTLLGTEDKFGTAVYYWKRDA